MRETDFRKGAALDDGSELEHGDAGFLGVVLLWIVAIPLEEAIYRGCGVSRGRLKFWPLGFAAAGLMMTAGTSVLFAVIYLEFGFCVLAMQDYFCPFCGSRLRSSQKQASVEQG